MIAGRSRRAVHRVRIPYGGGAIVVYAYLVRAGSLALIDTGVAGAPAECIAPALAALGLSLADVDVILNTHAHLDHAGGNREVREASGADVHVHEADVPMAESVDVQVEAMVGPLRELGLPDRLLRAREAHVRATAGLPAGVDHVLRDGDRVDLGEGVVLQVVHTPGHSPGSVCFWWEEDGVLFTGDAVQGLGLSPGDLPLYFDAAAYRASLGRVAELRPRVMMMGHAFFGPGRDDASGAAPGSPRPWGPVLDGADVGALLRASVRESERVRVAVRRALACASGAEPGALARAAAAELARDGALRLVPETGLPASGAPTLAAELAQATWPGNSGEDCHGRGGWAWR